MFLASAGRVYCRRTPEEEFTRYLHSYGVMPAFRSALVWLYQLPVKPKDINEYFAEFLENRARDVTEMSKLRAEMCYKSAELTELKRRNQALDDQLKELQLRAGLEDTSNQSEEQNEKQFEIMQRFFEDLQEFHPTLLSRPSILLKQDEQLFGGESEGGLRKLKANIEKKDSYQDFVDDMKKFDPWGLVFPFIRKNNKKDEQEKSTKIIEMPGDDEFLAKQNRKKDEDTSLKTNDDDSRSLAELLHAIYSESKENEINPAESTPHQEEPITWDTEYWKQFFKEGDILPEFGISITDPKASMYGKVFDANTDLEVQYFNPVPFTSDDTYVSVSDIKQLLESHAKNMRLAAEPPEIHDSPATRNYRLDNVWTSPKFAYGYLPFKNMRPVRPSESARKSKTRLNIANASKLDTSTLDDVIKTDVSYGDPLLSCAKPLRAYSNTSKSSQKSSTAPSRRYSSSRPCSRERDNPTAVDNALPVAPPISKLPAGLSKSTVATRLPSNVVINRPKPSTHKYPQVISSSCKANVRSKSPSRQHPLSEMRAPKAGGDCYENIGRMVSAPQTQSEKDLSARSRRSIPFSTTKLPASGDTQLLGQSNKVSTEGGEDTKSLVKKPRESAYHFKKSPRQRALSDDDSSHVSDCEYKMIKKTQKELDARSSIAYNKNPLKSSRNVLPTGSRKRVTLTTDGKFRDRDRFDPCDPKEVVYMHPYPELLAERKLPTEDHKRGEKRFHQLCREHYGCEYIQKIQRQFDISLFDDM